MRFAVIESDQVVNVIEALSAADLPEFNLVAAPDHITIGWRWGGSQFTPPPRWPSVDAGRTELRARVKEQRDTREQGGFVYLGRRLDCDLVSAQRLAGAAQLAQIALAAGQAFSIEWTCADDSTLTMDGPEMLGAMVVLGGHVQALHARARVLKDQIAAAATLAELAAIEGQIDTGWPA